MQRTREGVKMREGRMQMYMCRKKRANGEETREKKNCKTYDGVEKYNDPAALDVPLPFH